MEAELRQLLEGLKAKNDVIQTVIQHILQADFENMENLLDLLGISDAGASQSDEDLLTFATKQLTACWPADTIRPQVMMAIRRLSAGMHWSSRLLFSRERRAMT